MKFKVYKVFGNNSKTWDVGVYPTLKEAQTAALKEAELDAKCLRERFGFKTVIVEKETYTVKVLDAGQWRVWWYSAEPVEE